MTTTANTGRGNEAPAATQQDGSSRPESPTPPKVTLLGVDVAAVNRTEALAWIARSIDARERSYVCLVPAHSLMDARSDGVFREVLNRAGLALADGQGVAWPAGWLAGTGTERVYGPDLVLDCCRHGVGNGWRHFFYGGLPGVADSLAERLASVAPGLAVAGTRTPGKLDRGRREEREALDRINDTRPDIVWVGLGAPKQELWMAEHRAHLEAPLLIGVGAAFDFLTGRKPQAPRWVQRAGGEWLFRFASEPIRLWPRYSQYPLYAALVLRRLAGSACAGGGRRTPDRHA